MSVKRKQRIEWVANRLEWLKAVILRDVWEAEVLLEEAGHKDNSWVEQIVTAITSCEDDGSKTLERSIEAVWSMLDQMEEGRK